MKFPRFIILGAFLFIGLAALTLTMRRQKVLETKSLPEGSTSPISVQRRAERSDAAQAEKESIPARLNFASSWEKELDSDIAAFNGWARSYVERSQPVLLEQGRQLAGRRREIMKSLIKEDPRQAIASAVPMIVREQLPAEIREMLEERVAGEGSVALIGATPAEGESMKNPVFRSASIAGKEFRAYVYGRRTTQATKVDISIQGVALDGSLAVSESPLRVLEVGETPATSKKVVEICPISGEQSVSKPGIPLNIKPSKAKAVEVAGTIIDLCNVDHVAAFEARLIAAENEAGPYPGALSSPLTAANGLPGTSGVSGRPPLAWSTGVKKVLLIRVDFPGLTGTPINFSDSQPITTAYAAGVFNNPNGIADFYSQGSYGQSSLSISASDVTPVYRMPQTASYYAVGNGTDAYDTTLHVDARALATAGGFNVASYDRIGVVFSRLTALPGSHITYGGLGEIQGKNFWINGSLGFGVTAHEIGHNYGLQHSNLWQVTDGNPISASGTSIEYGDIFGVMSSATTDIRHHFDMWEKSILHWIPDASVNTITTSGTYRVNRFDHAGANLANPLSLKIVKNATQDYWIGFRKQFANNAALNNGAYILWGYNNVVQGNLLDFTTPGTDPQDAALGIGTSFYDAAAGFTITPVARGGASPNEYLDVRVNFGPFTGNVAPVGTIAGPATTNARQTCLFTAQATDADGDPLAYAWNFGQGAVFDNNASTAFAWESGGTYTVKVTVTDMKGHSVLLTKVVTVSDPITTWTARANSSVGDFTALAQNGTSVLAVGQDYTIFKGPVALSTNGVTWTATTLGSNQQGFGVVWDGVKWVVAGMDYDFSVSAWKGSIFTSPDATTWTRRYFSGLQLNAIAANGNVLVAAGEGGTIIRSTDGIAWAPVTSGTTSLLTGVAYGGGKFVAVGRAAGGSGTGICLTSTDGISWSNVSAGMGILSWQDLRSVVWAGDRFLSSGWYSKIRHSVDLGSTFSTLRTRTEETPAMAYGNGVWFAAGEDRDNADADIDLVSTDGSNWVPLTTPNVDPRTAGIFFKNTFITVGENHSIRQSGTILPAANGYVAWRESNFPDHDLLSTHDKDADGDGAANLVEYSLGRSPLLVSNLDGAASLPTAAIASANPLLNDRIALQVSLPEPAAGDITYVVEGAATLDGSFTPLATKIGTGGWTWNPGGTSRIVIGSPAGGRVNVTVGDSQAMNATTRRFLRMRFSVSQ